MKNDVELTNFFPALHASNAAVALLEGDKAYSYQKVYQIIQRCAYGLLRDTKDLNEEPIACLIPAGLDYVTTLHGIWAAGGMAVPLNTASAINELEHYLNSAQVRRLIINPEYQSQALEELCQSLNITILSVKDCLDSQAKQLPNIEATRRSLMLFTSGTTSKPKGVVHTHASISAQITCLLEAWAWSAEDSIPLFLPLHHVHGIINILSCALWCGARVHLFSKFDAATIAKQAAENCYTVFMAVPTIYVKLIQHLEQLEPQQRQAICAGFAAMRLNVSGSAACPVKLFEQWQTLTGQVLLERYGMTEIGMAISNPYQGERRAGHVGQALPGVEVELFDENNRIITTADTPGEIRIKGPNLFLEYWHNPEATQESYINGWFCTGDMAVIDQGYYRIMGRSSIDIIKSGGYKLSALEIEGVLLNHPAIAEVAVIGIDDETWGEAVAAIVVLKAEQTLNINDLKDWCSEKMSGYKIPKYLKLMDSLPRNVMGKVTKPTLKSLF